MSLNNKVRLFYSMWYSANIMNLAVLGKGIKHPQKTAKYEEFLWNFDQLFFSESLDQLEEIVVPLFKGVRNTNAKQYLFPYEYHPWGPNELKNKMYIVPLDDTMQLLRLSFPVPDMRDQYRAAVNFYFILFSQWGLTLLWKADQSIVPI